MGGPQKPPPLLRRASATDEIKKIEGYSISPAVAVTSSFLVLSYLMMGIAPSSYVFATMTNLCYLAAGFHREAAAATDKHSVTLLVGQMGGGAVILVLMGASSFAFHREADMYSPAHTLDITFGWLLVVHVFYSAFSLSLLALAKYCRRAGTRILRTALSLSLLIAFTIIMTFYDDVYSNQDWFYFTIGPAAAVFGGIARFLLVFEEGKFQWRAFGIAMFEVVVALSAVLAAIICQGSLLGRKITISSDPKAYDLFHGNWHFLLALVCALLYSRIADAARIVQGTHVVCVCNLPALDLSSEVLILVYSATCIVLKETKTSTQTCLWIMAPMSSFFAVHGLFVARALLPGDDAGGRERNPKIFPLDATPLEYATIRINF